MDLLEELLSLSTLTLATSDENARPHAAPVYFVALQTSASKRKPAWDFYFFSDPKSQHARDLAHQPHAAAALYPECWGWQEIRGLQMRGAVRHIPPGPEWQRAWEAYRAKFPFVAQLETFFEAIVARNRLYVFTPAWIRLVDNRFGFGQKEEWAHEKSREKNSHGKNEHMNHRNPKTRPETPDEEHSLDKAARCGEPSYVWRAGQERRLHMILEAAGERLKGKLLENGCGVGMYVDRLAPHAGEVIGLEYDFERARIAGQATDHLPNAHILDAAGESLPFPEASFTLILSHEVLEHVQDDRLAVCEMVRTLQPGGRIVLFAPNRGYPFETHGIYWRGRYRFGNIPLVNYLPRRLRDRLAPHVGVYARRDLERLFSGLPVRFVKRTIIFGAYDNIIARWPGVGKALRKVLQALERTPLRVFGLSHFWVIERL